MLLLFFSCMIAVDRSRIDGGGLLGTMAWLACGDAMLMVILGTRWGSKKLIFLQGMCIVVNTLTHTTCELQGREPYGMWRLLHTQETS